MKLKLVCILVLQLLSCAAQQVILPKEKQSDIIIIDNSSNIDIYETNINRLVMKDNGHIVFFQKWEDYGDTYAEKQYVFYKGGDTMKINCSFGQQRNIYFRNYEFQKGNFELSYKYDSSVPLLRGEQINVSDKTKKTIIKNVLEWGGSGVFKNTKFEDLTFFEVDMSDTSNKKWTKLN